MALYTRAFGPLLQNLTGEDLFVETEIVFAVITFGTKKPIQNLGIRITCKKENNNNKVICKPLLLADDNYYITR